MGKRLSWAMQRALFNADRLTKLGADRERRRIRRAQAGAIKLADAVFERTMVAAGPVLTPDFALRMRREHALAMGIIGIGTRTPKKARTR